MRDLNVQSLAVCARRGMVVNKPIAAAAIRRMLPPGTSRGAVWIVAGALTRKITLLVAEPWATNAAGRAGSPKTHPARVISRAACVGGAQEDDTRFVGEAFRGGATGAVESFRFSGRTRNQDLRVRGDRFDVVRDLVGGRGDIVDDQIGDGIVDNAGDVDRLQSLITPVKLVHDQFGDVDPQRDELQRRDLLFHEDVLGVGPGRKLANLVRCFLAHGVVKLVLGESAEDDQDASEGELRFALDVQRLLPLLFRDNPGGDEALGKEARGIVRRAGNDLPLVDEKLFLALSFGDDEPARAQIGRVFDEQFRGRGAGRLPLPLRRHRGRNDFRLRRRLRRHDRFGDAFVNGAQLLFGAFAALQLLAQRVGHDLQLVHGLLAVDAQFVDGGAKRFLRVLALPQFGAQRFERLLRFLLRFDASVGRADDFDETFDGAVDAHGRETGAHPQVPAVFGNAPIFDVDASRLARLLQLG